MIEILPSARGYRVKFAKAHTLPLPCYFCHEPVTVPTGKTSRSLAVHHINGDHSDDRLENMTASHYGCHQRFHMIGFKHGPDARRKVSEARKGKRFTEEHREMLSFVHSGRTLTEEHRAAIGRASVKAHRKRRLNQTAKTAEKERS